MLCPPEDNVVVENVYGLVVVDFNNVVPSKKSILPIVPLEMVAAAVIVTVSPAL